MPANVGSAIRLISFDLDDTLWDVGPALQAAEAAQWHYLEKRYPALALRLISKDEISVIRHQLLSEQPALAHHISQFRQAFIGRLLRAKGVDRVEAEDAAEQAFAAFYTERHKVSVYQDAPDVLETLGRSFLLAALTNGNADVTQTPIGCRFDYAWRAEQFGVSKPDPEFFIRAFRVAGVTPQEVIHIGDCHENDVSGAVNAGARAIWYNPAGELSTVAHDVVTDLKGLPDAIHRLVASLE
ncbi:MAG: HAD family hydrolase [Halieaceae bacterium]